MISAQILRHSINSAGNTLTTWKLTYPRFIHNEFMTHRDFSRNAASSRAIPIKRTLESLLYPTLPVWWGREQKGMQSGDELVGESLAQAKQASFKAMQECETSAYKAIELGLHKSVANRWIEPWLHITVIATASDHRNFFALRAHPEAQPELQVLAYRMLELYLSAKPQFVEDGDWHIPFSDEFDELTTEERIKVATARACWTSYNRPDKEIDGEKTTFQDAYDRHDLAAISGHWSPFEHCAKATDPTFDFYPRSNFDTDPDGFRCGWIQYRKLFQHERKTSTVDLNKILSNRPEWTKTVGF